MEIKYGNFAPQTNTSVIVKEYFARCFCNSKLFWCPYILIFDFTQHQLAYKFCKQIFIVIIPVNGTVFCKKIFSVEVDAKKKPVTLVLCH